MRTLIWMLLLIHFSECVVYPTIPSHLLECYRSDGPQTTAPRRLDVFLNLVRRLELTSQLDMRLFSSALLRSFRLDGIEEAANAVETEFVTPYRASLFQFHKYKLLMDLFLPSQDLLDVDNLAPVEKCLLHKMVSSTVRHWERGDEATVCPLNAESNVARVATEANVTRLHSRCPIEDGVIQTIWGTISPGTLISAITSSLEAQRVVVTDILNADVFKASVSEPLMTSRLEEWDLNIETLDMAAQGTGVASSDISNIWVASLAGDLAEVVVNQGPKYGFAQKKLVIGSNNRWNDTILPRDYYLLVANESALDWQITDAEILAGIDGLIISNYLPNWVSQRSSLRLSQVINMYYSNEGISFDPTVKACNRQSLFEKIFDKTQLLAEVKSLAPVLSLAQGTVYVPGEQIDKISESVVTAFVSYYASVISNSNQPCNSLLSAPVVDLLVATDAAFKGYDVEQIVSWLGNILEAGQQRSNMALLHGNTGNWVAPSSANLTHLFTYINNFTDPWPDRLNFPRVLTTIIQYCQNKTVNEIGNRPSVSPSTVVLVISPSDQLSPDEVEASRSLMQSLRMTYFDVIFVYVGQDLTGYKNINNEYMDSSEIFIQTETSTIVDVMTTIWKELIQNPMPKSMIGTLCPVNGTSYIQRPFEDFVIPAQVNYYLIHPYYIQQQPLVTVTFRNSGQGELSICTWRGVNTNRNCTLLGIRQTYSYNMTSLCQSIHFCLPVHFSVTVSSSLNNCANNDCRLPNEVNYYIEHTGLRCLLLHSGAAAVSSRDMFTRLVVLLLLFGIIS